MTTVQPQAPAAVFETLLAPLLAPAYNLARNLARNASEADDLIQEAALHAYRGFDSFIAGSSFKAWFYRILTNCYYHRCRQAKRQPSLDLAAGTDIYLLRQLAGAGLYKAGDELASMLMSKMTAEHIRTAMAALPDEYRVVVTLHFVEEMRYHEIVAVLDCPIGTVRSRLHRGRKLLQENLWKVAQEAGGVRELVERRGKP